MAGEILTPRYNYSGLDSGVADKLHAAADVVRTGNREAIESIARAGAALIEAKALLAHGEWGKWLAAEFCWSERTAENWMAVAANIPNPQRVADLPLGTVYRLAAADEAVRNTVLERLEGGRRVTAKEVAVSIAAFKHEEKVAPMLTRRKKISKEKAREIARQRFARMDENERKREEETSELAGLIHISADYYDRAIELLRRLRYRPLADAIEARIAEGASAA